MFSDVNVQNVDENPAGCVEMAPAVEAGWARVDMTPVDSVPLAGYTHLSDRMSERVRDPLFARALVLRQEGGPAVALVEYDLVITTEDMYQGLKSRLADTGLEIICSATHTHSAFGGFWKGTLGRAFLGRFREGSLERVVDAGEAAVRAALADMGPATVASGSVTIPGLNGNRRDHQGPVDEELQVVRLGRGGRDAILFSYPGHPVIVAERAHNLVSADFPGDAVRRIEREFDFAMYVAGALGGVDVKFPKTPVTVDENLEMMAGPIANSAVMVARVAASAPCGGPVLAYSRREVSFDSVQSRWSYDDDRRTLDCLLDRIGTSLVRNVPRVIRVEGLRIGGFAIIGIPADIGIGLSLRIKDEGRARGFDRVVTMSQTGGCVGYVHLPEDYAKTPADEGDAITMGRYENAMNFFGHDSGTRILGAAIEVLDGLDVKR